jgi:hypothetical protein
VLGDQVQIPNITNVISQVTALPVRMFFAACGTARRGPLRTRIDCASRPALVSTSRHGF